MWSRVRDAHAATKQILTEVLNHAETEGFEPQEGPPAADQLLHRWLDRNEVSDKNGSAGAAPSPQAQRDAFVRLFLSAQELVEALDSAGVPQDGNSVPPHQKLTESTLRGQEDSFLEDDEDPYPIPPSSFIPPIKHQHLGASAIHRGGAGARSEPSTRSTSPVSATGEDTDPRPEVKRSAGTTIIDDQGLELLCDFEIIRPLGKGTFGSVSLVADSDGELFAIKTLHQDPRRRVLFSASPFPSSRFSSPTFCTENTSGTMHKTDDVKSPTLREGNRELHTLQASSTHLAVSTSQVTRNPAIEREIAVMKKLRHPNIVQLHSVIEDPHELQTHLVMQYIDNGPIGVLSAEGRCEPRPPLAVLKYMRQVARGLAYLHQCGIAHCDLKPENILISSDDLAYISDFGLSKMLDSSNTHNDSIFTRQHSANRRSNFGTLAFCPPELLLEEERREKNSQGESQRPHQRTLSEDDFHKADIWAFGVTLYCVLFGKLPFFGATTNELINTILNGSLEVPTYFPTPTSINEVNRTTGGPVDNSAPRTLPVLHSLRSSKAEPSLLPVPKQVIDLLGRLLAKDPVQRMPLESFRRLHLVRHPERYFLSATSQLAFSTPNRAEKKPDLSTQLVPLLGSLSTLSAADCGTSQKSTASIETPPQDRTPLQDCTSSPTVPILLGAPQAFGSTPDSVPFPSFRGDSLEVANSPQVSLTLNSMFVERGSGKGILPPTASTASGSKLQPMEGSSHLHLSDSFAVSSTSIPTVMSPTISEMNDAISYRCLTFRRTLQPTQTLPTPPKRLERIEEQRPIDAHPSNQTEGDMSPLPLPNVSDLTPRTESCFVHRLRTQTVVSRELLE